MRIREWWSKVGRCWNRNIPPANVGIDDDPLRINSQSNSVVPLRSGVDISVARKKDSAEIVSEAVNKLTERLEQINAGISLQSQQNQQLVEKINLLPDLLSGLPQQAAQQRQILEDLSAELKAKSSNDHKLLETVAGMTEQAVEQTHKLGEINEHLLTAEKTNRQLADNMNTFNDSLGRLDANTVSQTEWIQQMSRSFTATDRYLKYTLAQQQRRFMWVFITSMAVSVLAVAGLIIGIVILSR